MLAKMHSLRTGMITLMLLPFLVFFAAHVEATNIIGISGGIWHSGAVDDTGAVWSWGANSTGQLGDGTNDNAHYPVRVIDTTDPTGYLYDVTSVDAGRGTGSLFESHTIALKQDGTVWAWGWNAYGQLGVNENSAPVSRVPVQVAGLTGINAIDAGTRYNLALKNPEGSVWAWGENNSGQLGIDPATASSSIPLSISGLAGVTAIAAGDNHGLAVKSDTSVWAWGGGDWGALGDGSTEFGVVLIPVQVVDQGDDPLAAVTQVDAGTWFSLARKSDGTVWSWGVNESGQLGDGSNNYRKSAGQVSGLANITHIAAGGQHALARRDDGTVWAWGLNSSGQLGNNSTTASNVPVQVLDPSDLTGKLTNVIAVGAGKDTSFAIKSDGTAWGWGNNYAAQIGVGEDQANKLVPVQILFTDKSNRMFELLGPYFITPGETVNYVLRYKNVLNSVLEDAIALVELPGTLEYVKSGSNGIYWPARRQVFWKLGNLQPGDTGVLSLEANVRWGLEPHTLSDLRADIGARNLSSGIDIDEYFGYEQVQIVEQRQLSEMEITSLVATNTELASNFRYAKALGCEDLRLAYKFSLTSGEEFFIFILLATQDQYPVFLYAKDNHSFIMERYDGLISLYDAAGGYRIDGRNLQFIGWGQWSLANSPSKSDCVHNCWVGYHLLQFDLLSPEDWFNANPDSNNCVLCSLSRLLGQLDSSACFECIQENFKSNKSSWRDFIISSMRAGAICTSNCNVDSNLYPCAIGATGRTCVINSRPEKELLSLVLGEGEVISTNWLSVAWECVANAYGGTLVQMGSATDCGYRTPCVDGFCSTNSCSDSSVRNTAVTFCSYNEIYRTTEAITPHDPNEKSVNVVGDVLPGQTLSYTIDYENVGAGTAYEVFILDQLDADLDADSLLIRDGGNYTEATRLLGWDIGELGAGEQGKVSFSIDVLSGLPAGSEIINAADIYFPSAGEITPTNAVVNRVALIKAEPQDVQTTGHTPVVIDLYGQDTLGSSLSYAVTSGPLYGELTGMPPSVVYTAMSEFSGMDELYFTTSNGSVTSEPARVTINVLPDPADTHPPGVIRTSPIADETGVATGTTPVAADPDLYTPFITATFSEPMDNATITTTSFTLDGVSGTVGYDELTRQAMFSPLTPLTAATTYTARLHTGIADKLGNALQDQYSWQFTIASPANILVSLPDPVGDTVDLRVSAVGSVSDERIVTVSSSGQLDLEIGSLVITGLHAGDFQLEADNCTNNSLPPGSHCTVALAFKPGAVGIREAILTIPSNDSVVPSHGVPLTGLGVTPFCSGDAVTINSRTFPAGLSICHGTSSVTTSSTAGTNITVARQADVHFVAPQISLNNGFKVNTGGYFHSGTRYTPAVLPEP